MKHRWLRALALQIATILAACLLQALSYGVSAGLYSYSGAASPAVEKMVGWLRSGGQAHAAALLDDALKNVFRSQSADDVSLAILLRAGAAAEG